MRRPINNFDDGQRPQLISDRWIQSDLSERLVMQLELLGLQIGRMQQVSIGLDVIHRFF
jgi:hypothetical protein